MTVLPDQLGTVASWSAWVPFAVAVRTAPRLPGVYLARRAASGPLVYVGMAGERRGAGIRSRLSIYDRGRAAVSGLGEAALDRALADPGWLRQRLAEVEAGQTRRAVVWAQEAIRWADLHISWTTTVDRAAAMALERSILQLLVDQVLWNRLR